MISAVPSVSSVHVELDGRPVVEEVLSRLDSQNVEGEPPVTPGENRSSVGKDTVKRSRSNDD